MIVFFSLHKNISCRYSLDEPHQGSSNEYSLHVFASPRCIKLIPTTYVLMENWRKLSQFFYSFIHLFLNHLYLIKFSHLFSPGEMIVFLSNIVPNHHQ